MVQEYLVSNIEAFITIPIPCNNLIAPVQFAESKPPIARNRRFSHFVLLIFVDLKKMNDPYRRFSLISDLKSFFKINIFEEGTRLSIGAPVRASKPVYLEASLHDSAHARCYSQHWTEGELLPRKDIHIHYFIVREFHRLSYDSHPSSLPIPKPESLIGNSPLHCLAGQLSLLPFRRLVTRLYLLPDW